MSDIELVIKIPEDVYKRTIFYREFKELNDCITTIKALEKGTLLPKGHGRLVDISKIDEDMVDDDNPIIYLTTNRQYIEAVSLDYLNDLPTILEADEEDEE
jgi:hypothetical protein